MKTSTVPVFSIQVGMSGPLASYLVRQAGTTLGAAASQDLAAVGGSHSLAETVDLLAVPFQDTSCFDAGEKAGLLRTYSAADRSFSRWPVPQLTVLGAL